MAVCTSMINMKGGVGKTTIASQVAWYAALRLDKKVGLPGSQWVDLPRPAEARRQ